MFDLKKSIINIVATDTKFSKFVDQLNIIKEYDLKHGFKTYYIQIY